MPREDYRHEIRVSWADCDPARIAYTGRIPMWALEAINGFWEHNLDGDGWYQMELDRNAGTPFVHMTLDFRAPVTPRHRLVCHVRPLRLGRTSVRFRVRGYQDGGLCFEGEFVNVFTVADSFTPQPAPADYARVIESYLETEPAG